MKNVRSFIHLFYFALHIDIKKRSDITCSGIYLGNKFQVEIYFNVDRFFQMKIHQTILSRYIFIGFNEVDL